MCLFTSCRTVAIVFARSAGSEAMYCAGVLTLDGGFIDSSSFPDEVYHRTCRNQPPRLRAPVRMPTLDSALPELVTNITQARKRDAHSFQNATNPASLRNRTFHAP